MLKKIDGFEIQMFSELCESPAMIAIKALLKVLFFRSILEATLQAMSEADRRKYDHGESVSKILSSCRRGPQNDLEKDALKYYTSIMADVEEKVKARLAEISESNSDCFIEVLRLSGFPDIVLDSSNVYQTIVFACVHIKSMSDHLRTIRSDSPVLLRQLEAYSKLLVAFTPSIIWEILKELGMKEDKLTADINTVCVTSFYSFSQFFASLMQPTSVEFKKIHAFALLNAAMHEKDVSKWSPDHFEIMKNCAVSILENTKISPLEKVEFIMQLVPNLIKLLEESTIWKEDKTCFHGNFRLMFEVMHGFSRPGFLQAADYTTVLQKFPDSGFPPTLQELPAFMKSKLQDNYNRLKHL